MPRTTVIALMDDPAQARLLVEELLHNGFSRNAIGIITRDPRGEGEAVFDGSMKGMAVGALAGLVLAAAAFMVPGLGPVLVAGPMAGAAVGALAGGLAGGLMSHGVPQDEAHFYAEGVQRGGTLVSVDADNDELAARAVEIMKRHGAVDVKERAEEWKQQGWNGRSEGAQAAPRPVETQT
jgi:hypothetical protein